MVTKLRGSFLEYTLVTGEDGSAAGEPVQFPDRHFYREFLRDLARDELNLDKLRRLAADRLGPRISPSDELLDELSYALADGTVRVLRSPRKLQPVIFEPPALPELPAEPAEIAPAKENQLLTEVRWEPDRLFIYPPYYPQDHHQRVGVIVRTENVPNGTSGSAFEIKVLGWYTNNPVLGDEAQMVELPRSVLGIDGDGDVKVSDDRLVSAKKGKSPALQLELHWEPVEALDGTTVFLHQFESFIVSVKLKEGQPAEPVKSGELKRLTHVPIFANPQGGAAQSTLATIGGAIGDLAKGAGELPLIEGGGADGAPAPSVLEPPPATRGGVPASVAKRCLRGSDYAFFLGQGSDGPIRSLCETCGRREKWNLLSEEAKHQYERSVLFAETRDDSGSWDSASWTVLSVETESMKKSQAMRLYVDESHGNPSFAGGPATGQAATGGGALASQLLGGAIGGTTGAVASMAMGAMGGVGSAPGITSGSISAPSAPSAPSIAGAPSVPGAPSIPGAAMGAVAGALGGLVGAEAGVLAGIAGTVIGGGSVTGALASAGAAMMGGGLSGASALSPRAECSLEFCMPPLTAERAREHAAILLDAPSVPAIPISDSAGGAGPCFLRSAGVLRDSPNTLTARCMQPSEDDPSSASYDLWESSSGSPAAAGRSAVLPFGDQSLTAEDVRNLAGRWATPRRLMCAAANSTGSSSDLAEAFLAQGTEVFIGFRSTVPTQWSSEFLKELAQKVFAENRSPEQAYRELEKRYAKKIQCAMWKK